MKKGVKLGAQNLLLLNLIKLFFMDVFIICLIGVALMFGVEYFERRHMRLFKLKAESQGGENIVSAVDQVYYGGKESDKREAERLRTRKIKYVLWVLIVFFGAAAAIFDSYKQELLEGWSSLNQSQKTEVSKTATQIPQFFNLRLYRDYEDALRYYEEKKVSAYKKAETEHAKYQQAVAQAQSRADKIINEEKLAKAEEKLTSTKEALDEFDSFASDLSNVTVFQYWCYALFAIGFLSAFYTLYQKKKTGWALFACIVLSIWMIVGIIFGIYDWVTRSLFSVVELTVLGLIISACILIAKCCKYTS